jgi:predicted DCC family thiol-disulfide oxidoreductase YuxK
MRSSVIVLYDGDCGLCSAAVQFLLTRDASGSLRFAPLDSAAASNVTAALGGISSGIDSILLVTGDRVLVRSSAVLAAARHLRAPWPLLARVASIVPVAVRDAVYDVIARNRHRLFPARACIVPTEAQRSRFL